MFANVSHFHLSLFAGKAGAYQSGAPYVTHLNGGAPSHAQKYLTNAEVFKSGKQSSLLR